MRCDNIKIIWIGPAGNKIGVRRKAVCETCSKFSHDQCTALRQHNTVIREVKNDK